MFKQLHFKSWMLALILIIGGGNLTVSAETVTIDLSAQGYTNQQEVSLVTSNSVTLTFDKGSSSNAPKYYSTGTAVRVYGGGTMTVSSTNTITGIELTFSSGESSNAITTNVGTYSNNTWSGSANEVTFTVGGTSGHRRIQKVQVTYTASSTPDDPTPDDPTPSTSGDWVETTLADLTANDVFVIVGNNGSNYAMSNNNGTSSAPSAVAVTVSNNELTGTIADNIKWTVSGNATDGYVFYPYNSTTTWLYCTNANNGVRVGDGNAKHFKQDTNGYLNTTETSEHRYIGVYNSQDWRCYTNTTGNIANQTFTFYKLDDSNKQEAGISFATTSFNINVGKGSTFTAPTLVNPNNLAVTYSYVSSNSTNEVGLDESTGDILIEAKAIGTVTVTAAFAGNDSYKSGSASYTINIVENRVNIATINSISPLSINFEADGTFAYDITFAEGTTADDYEVTFTGSDDDILLVESTGDYVAGSEEGSVTVTVTVEPVDDDSYLPVSRTFTVNVVDPNPKGTITNPYTVAQVLALTTAPTGNQYVKGFIVGCYNSGSKTNFTTTDFDIASNLAIADSPTETNVNNTIAVQLPTNSAIRTAFALSGSGSKPYNAGVAQIVVSGSIESYITSKGVKNPDSFAKVAEQVSISSAGMATYYTDCALDFTGLNNMWAYTAAVTSDGAITYTRVNRVPAETPVVLYNQNGAASNLVPVAESTEAIGDNALIGKLADYVVPQTEDGATNYLLNNGANGVGFYKASGTHKVAAHRAYLQVPASVGQVRSFYGFNNGGISTGIVTVDAVDNADQNIYDLQGRQVAQPTRGLYIVNGKKVIK